MFSWLRKVAAALQNRGRSANEPELSDVYSGLREQALRVQRSEIGMPAPPAGAPVWGLLMEFRSSKAAVTLFTLDDGTASLYFSNGGGVIGGHTHETVRRAITDLIRVANQFHESMAATDIFSLPGPGDVIFYALTDAGTLTTTAPEDELGKRRHPLSILFCAGHAVITELRLISEENTPVQ